MYKIWKLIKKKVADMIRQLVDEHDQAFPSVLEIPSKDHPYDPSKDSVLKSKINISILYI